MDDTGLEPVTSTMSTHCWIGQISVKPRKTIGLDDSRAVSHDILDFTARVLVASAVDTDLSSLEPSLA
jgi:hypothetical protein